MPLAAALASPWRSDAHTAGYVAQRSGKPCPWRLASRHVDDPTLTVTMAWAIFDLDGPDHAADPRWRAQQLARILELPTAPVAYQTKGGMRLMWQLARPFPIASAADAARWRACYLAACDWLACFGLEADRACADWTRLFRLPDVIRDGVRTGPIKLLGDAHAVGELEIERFAPATDHASSHAVPDAVAVDDPSRYRPVIHSRAGRLIAVDATELGAGPVPRRDTVKGAPSHSAFLEPASPTPEPGDGSCRLLDACSSRGLLLDQDPDNPTRWQITCPNAREHTTAGTDAMLFADCSVGTIRCFHSHCQGIDRYRWLDLLGARNLERVIVRVARAFDNGDHVRIVLHEDPEHAAECRCAEACGCPPLRTWEIRLRVPTPDSDDRTWARWSALWAAVDPTEQVDVGDLRAACRAVQGRPLAVELDGARVARFHAS